MFFEGAAIRNYQKFGSLEQQKFILSVLRPEVQNKAGDLAGFFWL